MANIKVSELPTATEFNDDDYVMIVQSNTNKKITKENMYGNYLFSTEEIIIGKWVDDKPIYRKTFIGTSTDVDGVSINIANLNADVIVDVYGWVKSSYGQWWPLNNYYTPESQYSTSMNYTANYITVHCESYFSYPEYRIVLEYTKTTD